MPQRSMKLADALIGVVDDIRRSVHDALGTRPWSFTVVRRIWSGGAIGDGIPSTHLLTIDPPPRIDMSPSTRLSPGGLEQTGSVRVSEISLRYSAEELAPRGDASTEVGYLIRDAHGHGVRDGWYTLSSGPIPRRGDGAGDATDWTMMITHTGDMSPLDGDS